MEDDKANNWVDEVWGVVTDDSALSCCPETVQHLVSELAATHAVSPAAAVATALATAATALGPQLMASSHGIKVPVTFNLIIFHDSPRSLPWFDLVTSALLSRVLEMEADLSRHGVESTRAEVAQLENDLLQAKRTLSPNRVAIAALEADAQRSRARLEPFVLTTKLDCRSLSRTLQVSFDQGLTMVSAGTDAGDQLLRLKRSERADIAEVLNRSWNLQPLSFGTATYSGVISLMVQSRRSVKELLGRNGFDPAFIAVPILALEERSSSLKMTSPSSEIEWKAIVNTCFDHRLLGVKTTFTYSPETEAIFDAFAGLINEKLPLLPAPCRPHISWLNELAQRFALLLWVLDGHEGSVVAAEIAEHAVTLVSWLGSQHLHAVATAAPVDSTAHVDRAEQMLAKIRIKQPLTRRELWRSFDHPRVDWFKPTLAALLSSRKVSYNLHEELIPSE